MLTLFEFFSGIGGWSEAALMSGDIKPIGCSEIHPYKNKVYELRHPGVPNYGDITKITNAPYADIYTVSFPCTGISNAGKGEGLKNVGSRLWFDAERIIGQNRPQYVVIENGPTLNKRGLGRILAGLARFGYDAEWCCLSGHQFGIQQHRKRLYLIAYANKTGLKVQYSAATIFRKLERKTVQESPRISPGWRERWEIPQPRNYGSTNDLPSLIHRLECVGDAIIPLIGCYIFECIKIHHKQHHHGLHN